MDDPACAGAISIFAIDKSRESALACANCDNLEPITYYLDVTTFLENLSVRNKDEVIVSSKVTNIHDEDVHLDLPTPDILWENEFLSKNIDTRTAHANTRDTKQLTQFLNFYGYKEGDSHFGLSDALKKYQQFWVLMRMVFSDQKLDSTLLLPALPIQISMMTPDLCSSINFVMGNASSTLQ